MSKWLDKLVCKTKSGENEQDFRYDLDERTAIIQFDGEESECEYKALLDFVNENRKSLKKRIQKINGEEYLRLKE